MIYPAPFDRELLSLPLCRPEDLGQPLPASPHANSVCLPTWADVIDYERADPRVLQQLQTGYPRFFFHPLTEQLFAHCGRRFAGPEEFCQVYPTRSAAQRCLASVQRWTGLTGRMAAWSEQGPWVTCLPRAAADAAKKHWRHSGEGVSSRQAEALLQGRPARDARQAKQSLRQRIAGLTGLPAESVYLFPSGMSAIYTVSRAINRLLPARPSVQFGFPYVDTLKLQQDYGHAVHFFPRGSRSEWQQLQDLLRSEPVSGLYCEFPSNPLLHSPDLEALAPLARQQGVPLVVDETLASYVNVDLRSVADVLITSLTKYFAGAGDVMAGAAIINPRGPRSAALQRALEAEYEDSLWCDEALLLAEYAVDFTARIERINRTAETVCEYCRAHPAVAEVYYPKYSTPAQYAAFRRPGGGYGGLFSLLLKDAQRTAPPFFDALRISKGPNLGTYFTLCCPFTLLAHFDELPWAESCGVSRYLVRISVGLEEPQALIDRLQAALPGPA